MRVENSTDTRAWSDINHNSDAKKPFGGRMPYVFVRENKIKWWVTVQGLNYNEVSDGLQSMDSIIMR
jgi:hypothetical protein